MSTPDSREITSRASLGSSFGPVSITCSYSDPKIDTVTPSRQQRVLMFVALFQIARARELVDADVPVAQPVDAVRPDGDRKRSRLDDRS
jgi:hypothetical protein